MTRRGGTKLHINSCNLVDFLRDRENHLIFNLAAKLYQEKYKNS